MRLLKRLGAPALAVLALLAVLTVGVTTQQGVLLLGMNSGTARAISVTSTGAVNAVVSASSAGFTWAFGTLANDAAAIQASATMGSVPTAGLSVYSFTTTGAGNASQNITSFLSTMAAGYTGSSNTYAMRALNTTAGASSGFNVGIQGNSEGAGAGATNVGVEGVATAGGKKVGVYGSSAAGITAANTVFTGGITGIAGAFNIGTNTDDIIAGMDGTTTPLAVFRIKNAGDGAFASETGDNALQWDWTATSGGGNVRLLISGGTSSTIGTTNNIPFNVQANGTSNWSFSTAGDIDLLVAGKAIRYAMPVEANTGTKTPSALESNEHYTNTGDADGSAVTLLNDPTIGTEYTVTVTAALTITVTASAGETLYYGSSTCGTSLTSNTIGSSATIYAATGGSGALWITKASMGTWVCTP